MLMKFVSSKSLFFLLLTSLFFISCGKFEDITLGDLQNVEVAGFEDNYLKLNVEVPIENPTLHRINIKAIDVRVFINQQYIGKLIVDEQVLIKSKSSKVYQLPVKIRLANILNTAFLMMNLSNGKQVQFNFEGTVTVRTMLISREIDIKETRLVKM
jgi:LEA14-like dessication related protein